MAEKTQINPTVKPATKARLLEFCKERGYAQGEVVEAALEAYFTPADGDAQTLMFHKINELGQGMKDVVTLLGTVIQHLEKQAKPPPPKVATPQELYPALYAPVEEEHDAAAAEETPALPPRFSWRAIFGRRMTS